MEFLKRTLLITLLPLIPLVLFLAAYCFITWSAAPFMIWNWDVIARFIFVTVYLFFVVIAAECT
jgi:hypothetical protein